MENKNEIMILTDAMSLREISPAIENAKIEYFRIVGTENIKKFLEENKDRIVSKLKRQSYADGLKKETGLEFSVEQDTIFDLPYGGVAINVGLAYPTKVDLNDQENWDKGLLASELRIIKVCKPDNDFNL